MKRLLIILMILVTAVSCKEKKQGSGEDPLQENRSSISPKEEDTLAKLLKITNPQNGQIITSPLQLEGQARGYWFFEAEATVELFDEQFQKKGQTNITAIGDWMTEDWVKFSGTLSFEKPATKKGLLIFQKANPSGLKEHALSDTIVVEFE